MKIAHRPFLGDELARFKHRIQCATQHYSTASSFHTSPSHRTSHLFLDATNFQSVEECPTAPLHEKPFGRAKGAIVKLKYCHAPTEFYLVKTAYDVITKKPCFNNVKIRAEQLNREIMAECMAPYADYISVPETFIVVELASEAEAQKDGYIHEWLASRIHPLVSYPTQQGKVDYSADIQDYLRQKNYRPFALACLPLALIASWDHPGSYFSNVGIEKNTYKFIFLDFGIGSGVGQLGVAPFKRDSVIQTLDNMRYFDEKGRKIRDWDTLKIDLLQEKFGYYTNEVYPLDITRDVLQKYFSVRQCVKGIHLTTHKLEQIFNHVSAPVEWTFDHQNKQLALETYNHSLQNRKTAMFNTYAQRLEDLHCFISMVRFFYPEGKSDHDQLLPSAMLIQQRYHDLLEKYGENGLSAVTDEMKRNITDSLLQESGLEQANTHFKYREKYTERFRLPTITKPTPLAM